MPTISLPTTGTSNWGDPLNNYIGQIQDNNQGGTLNTFTSSTNLTPASKAQGYTYVHTNNSQIRANNVDTNLTPTNTQSNLLLQGVPQGGTTGDLLAQTASGVPSWASASGIGGGSFPFNLNGAPYYQTINGQSASLTGTSSQTLYILSAALHNIDFTGRTYKLQAGNSIIASWATSYNGGSTSGDFFSTELVIDFKYPRILAGNAAVALTNQGVTTSVSGAGNVTIYGWLV